MRVCLVHNHSLRSTISLWLMWVAFILCTCAIVGVKVHLSNAFNCCDMDGFRHWWNHQSPHSPSTSLIPSTSSTSNQKLHCTTFGLPYPIRVIIRVQGNWWYILLSSLSLCTYSCFRIVMINSYQLHGYGRTSNSPSRLGGATIPKGSHQPVKVNALLSALHALILGRTFWRVGIKHQCLYGNVFPSIAYSTCCSWCTGGYMLSFWWSMPTFVLS